MDVLNAKFYIFEVTLNGTEAKVDSMSELEEGQHVGITLEELLEAEQVVKADAEVQRLCAEVGKRCLVLVPCLHSMLPTAHRV